MKNATFFNFRKLLIYFSVFCFFSSCSEEIIEEDQPVKTSSLQVKAPGNTQEIEGHYIIILSETPAINNSHAEAVLEEVVEKVGRKPRAMVTRKYKRVFTGFAAELEPEQVEELKKDPRVKSIEKDAFLYTTTEVYVQEYVTWGLDRMDQREPELDRAYAYTSTGKGVTAYIIDSGIRYSHSEFGGRASNGYDFVLEEDPENTDPSQGPGEDCLGHGTHVAGTVGGNLYGVAKEVDLISVRVFGCSSGTPRSRAIAAVEWVTRDVQENNRFPAVVNMSLGGLYDPNGLSYELAIKNSVQAGINYVVAAGNSNMDACGFEPARIPEVITVAASRIDNQKADFSNFGDCVDIFAPGERILSASHLDDISTRTISGTSMASPHAAGMAALYLQVKPGATPAELHAALVDNSTPNAISNVPVGTNNLAHSLWEQIEFIAPEPPDLNLQVDPFKIRGENAVDLTWNPTEDEYVKIYRNGILISTHWNGGYFRDRIGEKNNNATYNYVVCEGNYINCSAEVPAIFGDGGGETNENNAPIADFTYTINQLKVEFMDASTDVDGSVVGWHWDLGESTSTETNPSHTFSAAGTYEVILTVTDDQGSTGSTTKLLNIEVEDQVPDENQLFAEGYKVKGQWQTDLTWTGFSSVDNLDIYRDNMLIATVANTGFFTDVTGFKGGGSLTYRICESGAFSLCSGEVVVQF